MPLEHRTAEQHVPDHQQAEHRLADDTAVPPHAADDTHHERDIDERDIDPHVPDELGGDPAPSELVHTEPPPAE